MSKSKYNHKSNKSNHSDQSSDSPASSVWDKVSVPHKKESKGTKAYKNVPEKQSEAQSEADIFEGTVLGHENGFGFLIIDYSSSQGSAKHEDIYLSQEELFKALHKDKVKVARYQVVSKRDEKERYRGEILELVEREFKEILGTIYFNNHKQRWFFTAKDSRYAKEFIVSTREENISSSFDVNKLDKDFRNNNKDAAIWVVAEVLNEGLLTSQPAVRILYQLDHDFDNLHFWQQAVLENGVSHVFTQELMQSIDEKKLGVFDNDIKSRKDYRDFAFVTIDGESAKDFDDAIFVEKIKSGYKLYVAIADVSHYIEPNTEIDKEAFSRGNSIYFPGVVVPMLPEIYSNEWCSLNPKVDRLVMVCEMEFNQKGECKQYQFFEGVIHSHQRLTYSQVQDYFETDDNSGFENMVQDNIDHARQLYKILRKSREQRGALDFNLPSSEIVLNDEGKLQDIALHYRNEAHTLIEECMLAANVCAGEYILQNSPKAGMYRVHEKPDEKKLHSLQAFLANFALSLSDVDEPTPAMFMKLINSIDDEVKLKIIQPMMLRSQQQAQYQANLGEHFALNYPIYSHFTSPIRRFPDLCSHRLIRSIIRQRPIANRFLKQLPNIAQHCSKTERIAEDMTREVDSKLKLQYLENHLGETYTGIITGIKDFGFFVELDNILVSGLVAVENLGSNYFYDEASQQLNDHTGKKAFSIGMAVDVIIISVNVDDKRLDLNLDKLVKQ